MLRSSLFVHHRPDVVVGLAGIALVVLVGMVVLVGSFLAVGIVVDHS